MLRYYSSYIFMVLPAVLLALWAQARVSGTFRKYSKVENIRGITGEQVARQILDANDIRDVAINRIEGELTDHFDPRTNTVNLSPDIYGGRSVAALGIAAHEVGHAIQHAQKYAPIKVRNAILPAVNIGSMAGMPLAILGVFMSIPGLIYAGIVLFSVVVAFQLVTLPVELNASARALAILRDREILYKDELVGARKVLTAAAMTYVAAAAVSIANLARLLMLANDRK